MHAPVADAGLGVGVREQPVQPGAAAALALTDPLGGLRLGLAEGGVDQRSNAASVMLCWISRSASTWNAST
jgi:hypothetical protein